MTATPASPGALPPARRFALGRGYARVLASHKVQSRFPTIVGVDTVERAVALTFDDGPHPVGTPAILDVLARYGAKGTFFLLGRNIEAHPGIAKRIVDDGHAVANHTFTHPCLADCSPARVARELTRCQRALRAATGISTSLMRPPYGAQAVDTFLTARAMGYDVIHWSASAQDWLGDDAATLAGRVLGELRPGGIALLHDGWEPEPGQSGETPAVADRAATIDALPLIIGPLQRDGYRFVTVPELLALGPRRTRRWFREIRGL